jgi:tRNA pseudouridine38-40 synthase
MPRYRLTVEYDGRGLVGWQRQDNGPSVQVLLEQAGARLAGHDVEMVAAGRTDAGVHATGQVVHADLRRDLHPDRVRDGLNYWLAVDRPSTAVAVRAAALAAPDFHARFQAIGRRYRYLIINRRPPLTLDRGRAWQVARPLDVARMQAAAELLLGTHDFTSFRATDCQARSPIKTLDRLIVIQDGEQIVIHAAARSFLHHQVRNMVGSLKWVGEGHWQPADLAAALAARDRRAGGPTAPPDGLVLSEVIYPDTVSVSS